MTKGDQWEEETAITMWAEKDKAADREEDKLAFYNSDLYMNYSIEDWNRAFVLMNYVRITREKPWKAYSAMRASYVRRQLWAPEGETEQAVWCLTRTPGMV